jgi:hypothetical protein
MTLALTGIAGAADNDNASIDALRAELNELRAQNNSLSARVDAQDTEWLNEERASEIRGIVQDVLADSQSRTSLQDSGMMAGYKAGKGFFLSNADGSFSLAISGQLQTRWVLNNNPGNNPTFGLGTGDTPFTGADARGNGEETSWGFQVRRAKVRFQGNVIDPSWTYAINGSFEGPDTDGQVDLGFAQWGTGVPSNGGTFQFEEAYIAKELDNGITLTFGQFKTPWMREELVDSSQQLAVERSVINEFFNQDRAVGIMANWNNDDFNVSASYNNGQASAIYQNTRYTNFSNSPTDWAFSARGEWKLSGDWSDFDSFTSSPGDEQAIMVGVAAMGQRYNQNAQALSILGVGDLSFDGTQVWGVTADISAKFGGFSLFASGVWQNYDPDYGSDVAGLNAAGLSGDSYDPWGIVLQAGYSLNDQWELFARYEEGNASFENLFNANLLGAIGRDLSAALTDGGNPSILTIGANYFINDNVKFTVDWGINFADQMDLFSQEPSNTGWESSDDSDQWVLRAQVQLLF